MEGHFSTGQSPQWAVVPMEEEDPNAKLPSSYLVLENLSENRNTVHGHLKWVGPCKLEMCAEIHKSVG